MTDNNKFKPIDIQLRLHPKEIFYPCDNNFKLLDIYPIYYNHDNDYAYMGKIYHIISYRVYYQHNGAIGLNGYSKYNSSLGYHQYDREHIRVLYDKKTFKPVYVYLSAHFQEGKYYKYEDMLFSDSNMIVYSSLNSHSHRYRAGTYWRVFGLANDYCSNKGKHINLTPILETDLHNSSNNREVFDNTWYAFMLPLYNSHGNEYVDKQKQLDNIKNQSATI